MIALNPDYLVDLHALPVAGNNSVRSALTAQKDALSYIWSETIRRINTLENLDTIAATLTLPSSLANHPYCRPYATSVADTVRAVYQQAMGWFDGHPLSLTVMSNSERMRRMVEMIGPSQALSAAQKALQEQTVYGADWALHIGWALSVTYPSDSVNAVLREALRRLAFSQLSAERRNYYLSTLMQLGLL